MKRFVVTGIGRSATNYTSKLLSSADIPTTWETAFQVNKRNPRFTEGGDSSWLSAPFLADLPDGTVVLHQLRDPLRWLESWLRVTPRWPTRHRTFVVEHSRMFRWDRGRHPQDDMRIWVRWHKMIEDTVKERGFPYLRFQVEELNLAKMQEIATLIEVPFKPAKAKKALEGVSKKTNTSKQKGRRFKVPNQPETVDEEAVPEIPLKWSDLPACPELTAFKALAVEYGYGVTDE